MMRAYWISCLTFFSILAVVRCGADPSVSTVRALDDQRIGAAGGALASGTARYAIDPNAFAARSFIKDAEVISRIANDLASLERSRQVTARYFTFTALYNAGISDRDLETSRFGLFKLINSLSYARDIKLPTAIDQERTIYRIDLQDYGWRRFTWDEVVRNDPYAIFTGSREERDVNRLAAVQRRAFVRADWFAFAASQGNLYHFIMEIPQNIRQFEFDLGVNTDRNIQRGDVLRAGFNGSGVSQQNRMIEWHKSRSGSYWKSYDFKPTASRARRNLFEFPLDQRNFRGGNGGFEHAGGEIIFSLPNGLQGYVLVDANDRRINKAPTDIVGDNERPDKAVTNGLSCHRCHSEGMLPAVDMIKPHVEKHAFAFNRSEVEAVRATYADQSLIDQQLKTDNQRYKSAMDKIGYSVKKVDPITALALMFEAEMPPSLVAAELGLTAAEFEQALLRSRFLSRRVGLALVTGGLVKRETYEDNFAFLVEQFGLGRTFFRRGQFGLTEGE